MALSGSLDKKVSYHREAAGSVSFIGGVTTPSLLQQAVGGILSFTGSVSRKVDRFRSVSGVLSFTGFIGAAVSAVRLAGTLTFTGTLTYTSDVIENTKSFISLTTKRAVKLVRDIFI